MRKVLNDIKKLVNVGDDNEFDLDITLAINTSLSQLKQLGVKVLSLNIDSNTDWDEVIEDQTLLPFCVSYIQIQVRQMFDPPTSSVLGEALSKKLSELEWRIKEQLEVKGLNT